MKIITSIVIMLIMLKYLNLETIIDDFRNNITKQLNNIEEEDKKQSRFIMV